MKKITAFIGSPRRNGNTEIMIDKIIDGIKTSNICVEKIFLTDYKISGCRGCLLCIKTGKCVNKDGMTLLYSKVEQSDGFIFASPTYNYNVTSEMKALIDRLFCYYEFIGNGGWNSRLGNSKKAIVLGVCAGSTKESMGYTIEAMKRPLEDLKFQIINEIVYYNSRKNPLKDNVSFQNELTCIGTEFARNLK